MKVSVIVPAFNEEKLIQSCLRSTKRALQTFTDLKWAWEIIVCDNNSTDRTRDIARAEGATVVFEPVNQISRARNRGASVATGDWLIFVDADSYPSVELFTDVAVAIQTGKYLGGGVTVQLDGRDGWARRLVGVWNILSRVRKWMAGSFVFCDADAFRELGGFSQDLFAGEELDLSQRLKQLASRRKKKIVILHRHPLLTSSRKSQLYTKGEYWGVLCRTLLHRGQNLRERANCGLWYDGRR